MELSALRSFVFSPSSSVSSAASSSSSSSRESHHRRHDHRHQQRPTDDRDDDVYHRQRKNRQHSFEQQQQHRHHHRERHHTRSSLTDRSMSSSRASSHRGSRNSDELSLASTCDDRVNLPMDKEFLPPDSPTQDEMKQEQVRDQVICMIFDLPESTQFYEDFSCAIASTLAMHGRMYPTSSHVCFYSNVFGRERKILIPYESIREIEKTTTMMFQHAIRLATLDKDEYTFTSFWGNNRDSCYDLILKTRDRVLRELRPTAVNSSETRYPVLTTSPVARDASPPASQRRPGVEQDDDEDEEEREEEEAAGSDHDEPVAPATGVTTTETVTEVDDDQTAPATPRRRSVVSDVDSIAPKDISMTQILEEEFPLSVDSFMQMFFLDNAPFGLNKFGEQTGSTEMTVNPWMTPLEDEKTFGMTRSLQFRVPVDAPIGPKSSQVDVLQCLKENEQGVRVVESSTRLVDIPYGDYFSVEDRWTIVPRSSNPNACKLFIEMKVVFGKSTFWKNTIETRAVSDNRAKWEKWVSLAKDFLCTRDLNDTANCTPESPPASSTSSEKAIPCDATRKDPGSMSRRTRSKPSHRHRNSTVSTSPPGGVRAAPVKVFPWVLVLLLLLVILRLQTTLSSIERSLLVNTELINQLQQHVVDLQAGACPVTV